MAPFAPRTRSVPISLEQASATALASRFAKILGAGVVAFRRQPRYAQSADFSINRRRKRHIPRLPGG